MHRGDGGCDVTNATNTMVHASWLVNPDALCFSEATTAAAAEATIDAKHEAEETKPEPSTKPNNEADEADEAD